MALALFFVLLLAAIGGVAYWKTMNMRISSSTKAGLDPAAQQSARFRQSVDSYWFLTEHGFLKMPPKIDAGFDPGERFVSALFEVSIGGSWRHGEFGEHWTRKKDGAQIPDPGVALQYFLPDYDEQVRRIRDELRGIYGSSSIELGLHRELIKRNPWVVTDDAWTFDEEFNRRYKSVMKDLVDGRISLHQLNLTGIGKLMKRVTLEQ